MRGLKIADPVTPSGVFISQENAARALTNCVAGTSTDDPFGRVKFAIPKHSLILFNILSGERACVKSLCSGDTYAYVDW